MLQRVARGLVLTIIVSTGMPQVAVAQNFASPQELLVPPEGGSTGGFGFATDIDGATAVVSSPDETVGSALLAGAVYVYVRNGSGAWVQQQRLTVGDTNQRFGVSVALSGDTLAVGSAPFVSSGTQPVRVYVRAGATWTLQAALGLHRATSVRVKGDILVVGDGDVSSGQGAVTIYERTGTSWGAPASFPAPGGGVLNAQFGASVDLSGASLCVGVPRDTANGVATAGSVRIMTRTAPGAWSQQQKIDGPSGNSRFGSACSIDGNTVAIGASNIGVTPTNSNGSSFVYVRSGTTWSLQQQIGPSSNPSGNVSGKSIRLVGDLLTLGGANNLAVFSRTGATWTERQIIPRIGLQFSLIGMTASNLIVGTTPPGAGHGSTFVYSLVATGTPGPPTNFQATVGGNFLSMSWGPPATGAPPTSYTLVAKSAAGATLGTVPLGLVTSFAGAAPNGVFLLSVTATNASGTGLESNSATVTLPSAAPPPGPPSGLAVSVSGNAASFTWNAPTSGGVPAAYVLLAGTTPGFAVPAATLPLAASPLSFAVGGIPPGTYYVRLLAQNAGGVSSASNEVALTVAGAPSAPTMNAPTVAGSVVGISWSPGGAGGVPTSYILTASLTAGGPSIGTVALPGTSLSVPGVPRGTYFLRVTAVNAAGPSGPSNEVSVTVP